MVTDLAQPDTAEPQRELGDPDSLEAGRRRFTIAVVVGVAIVSVPYLFVLWDLWTGGASFFRSVGIGGFYDEQLKALASGHLSVPKGSLGIEGFIHGGRTYTYFGLFPALLRAPILVVIRSLTGRLTAPSLLLAWLVTAAVSSMLLWRMRLLIRGAVAMGRAEAAAFGVLVASITGGSVLVFLAANPYVYDEDFAWSVALTVACMFALLGVLEQPTWRRVNLSGVLILAASLNRLTTGWACVIGALLVAGWFAFGRGQSENRRWVVPMLLAGLIPLGASCAVNWAKFGVLFGLPLADQVWTHVNPHRRAFLAANGGKGFSFSFLPTTMLAYLRPNGISFSSLFPFVTLPTTPPQVVGGVVLDQTYATASVTSSMPLLFFIGLWGVITAFRPHSIGKVRLTRVLLIATACGTAGVFLWGYIADRYLADLLPLLIVASGIGLVDIWRRLEGKRRAVRGTVLGVLAIVGAFSILVNVGAAIVPSNTWTPTQSLNFVNAQKAWSLSSLSRSVKTGSRLPIWGPTGQLYAMNNCSGLYLSNGGNLSFAPGQQIDRSTWNPVEQEAGINHTVALRFNQPLLSVKHPIPLFTYGHASLWAQSIARKRIALFVENAGAANIAWPTTFSGKIIVKPHKTYYMTVMTDPNMHNIEVRWRSVVKNTYGIDVIRHYLAGTGPAIVLQTHPANGSLPPVSVTDETGPAPSMALCRSLVKGIS